MFIIWEVIPMLKPIKVGVPRVLYLDNWYSLCHVLGPLLFSMHVHSSKLIIMQNKSVRIITGAHYRAHTTPIFKCLNFLKLVHLYQLQVNKYVL